MDTTKMDKVASATAERATDGQVVLARGDRSSMRMWRDEQPGAPKPKSSRPYEVLGFVLSGRAELHVNDRVVELVAGDSWLVPAASEHTYRILETFSAIETTTPPS